MRCWSVFASVLFLAIPTLVACDSVIDPHQTTPGATGSVSGAGGSGGNSGSESAGGGLTTGGPGGSSAGGATDDPSLNADLMQDNLSNCGLLKKGTLANSFENTFEGQCLTSCMARYQDCDVAREYVCHGSGDLTNFNSPLAECLASCKYFECADGSLTGLFNRCDSQNDCADGSDEADCPAVVTFECNNGVTIPVEGRCNVEIECGQGEDEEGCSPIYFHQCGDGKMIPQRWECDLVPDCADGSDEAWPCAKPLCN